MKKIAFIDLDGVLVKQGTQELLPGALNRLKEISNSYEIWYFSSWAFNQSDISFLKSLEVPFGIIQKPCADQYIYIDDKLDLRECGQQLGGKHGRN